MRGVALLVALCALASCSRGTYVVVEIQSSVSVMAVALDATLINGGQVAKAHFDRAGTPFGFPQSFFLKIEDERQGVIDVSVEVSLIDGSRTTSTGSTSIVQNDTAKAVVLLFSPSIADGGTMDMQMTLDLFAPRILRFTESAKWTTSEPPLGVLLGDLNGDAKTDVVAVVNKGAYSYLQQRLSSFSGGNFVGDGRNAGGFGVLADLDGDGTRDLVLARAFFDGLLVARGTGTGEFMDPVIHDNKSRPFFCVAGDVDADGRLDVLSSTNYPGVFSLFRGQGAGSLAQAVTFGSGTTHMGIAIADVNRDGRADVVAPNTGDATVSVFIGDGRGSFTEKSVNTGGASPTIPQVADFDKDGDLDVLVLNQGQGLFSLLFGDGTGAMPRSRSFQSSAAAVPFIVADLDGDGWLDLAAPRANESGIAVSLGGPGGTFQTERVLEGWKAGALAVEDLNRDGLSDLVVASTTDSTIQVLLNVSQ